MGKQVKDQATPPATEVANVDPQVIKAQDHLNMIQTEARKSADSMILVAGAVASTFAKLCVVVAKLETREDGLTFCDAYQKRLEEIAESKADMEAAATAEKVRRSQVSRLRLVVKAAHGYDKTVNKKKVHVKGMGRVKALELIEGKGSIWDKLSTMADKLGTGRQGKQEPHQRIESRIAEAKKLPASREAMVSVLGGDVSRVDSSKGISQARLAREVICTAIEHCGKEDLTYIVQSVARRCLTDENHREIGGLILDHLKMEATPKAKRQVKAKQPAANAEAGQ